ncbi:hypothetical protein FCV25MIE_22977 [Fagus crenata]
MAGAHCATTLSLLTPSINPTVTRTKARVSASLPTPPPPLPFPKPTKRKNYLRPKILKTLTKPPTNPLIPVVSPETKIENPDFDSPTAETSATVSPETENIDFESPTDETSADTGEAVEVEEFTATETSATAAGDFYRDGIVGKFSARSVLKYGAYFIGLFVFQTICTVWILGNANSDAVKDVDLDSSDSNNRKQNSSDNIEKRLFGSDSELEKKIEEIRAMAREARRSEANVKSGKEGGEDDEIDEESVVSKRRIGIEKEIGAKLSKLQKRLNSNSNLAYVDKLGKANKVEDRVDRDNSDSKEADGTLMFKKKLKFKSPSTKLRNGPKGFGGTRDRTSNVANGKKSDLTSVATTIGVNGSVGGDNGVELLEFEEKGDREDSDFPDNGTWEEDDERKSCVQESLSDLGNAERRNGVAQKTNSERSSVEVEKLQQSIRLETQQSQKFTNGNDGTTLTSDKHAVSSINGSSKHREVGNESLANKFREKRPNIETDFWWLRLPYVLAVVMRRGSDREEQGALYTLKSASSAQEQINSYTVAFEDRVDANNFCFLLESFFEDLGDFSADIVPISIKELHEAIKANAMKVIVVKKRQLQLYAGQPFADVETALRSLVEGD